MLLNLALGWRPHPSRSSHCRHGTNALTRTASTLLTAALFLIALFSTAACSITGPDDYDDEEPSPGDTKVLFIGSSYLTVNDLAGLFGEMAKTAGKQVFLGRRVQPGYYLDYFAEDETTAQAIQDQEWDYVILSGGCQTAAYPDTHHIIKPDWDPHPPYPAIKSLQEQVTANHPGTVLIYMMPWAFEDGMTWVAGQTDDYFQMQDKIRDNALAWSDSLDLVVAPVGMAWRKVMEDGVPMHYLHQSDWNHPAPRGSFLSASTLFATVFKESAEEVGYRWILDSAEAEMFRRIGSETVLDSLALWNLDP